MMGLHKPNFTVWTSGELQKTSRVEEKPSCTWLKEIFWFFIFWAELFHVLPKKSSWFRSNSVALSWKLTSGSPANISWRWGTFPWTSRETTASDFTSEILDHVSSNRLRFYRCEPGSDRDPRSPAGGAAHWSASDRAGSRGFGWSCPPPRGRSARRGARTGGTGTPPPGSAPRHTQRPKSSSPELKEREKEGKKFKTGQSFGRRRRHFEMGPYHLAQRGGRPNAFRHNHRKVHETSCTNRIIEVEMAGSNLL